MAPYCGLQARTCPSAGGSPGHMQPCIPGRYGHVPLPNGGWCVGSGSGGCRASLSSGWKPQVVCTWVWRKVQEPWREQGAQPATGRRAEQALVSFNIEMPLHGLT